jgi:hypothetical protein
MVTPPERKPSIKTDARDAARMVREDMLGYSRRCYIPSKYIEELRFHIFQMIQTGRKISRVKNQMHSVLERNMVHALDDLSDPFGKEGLERVASIELPEQQDMQTLKRHLEELALHARNHRELEIQLAKMVEDDDIDIKLLINHHTGHEPLSLQRPPPKRESGTTSRGSPPRSISAPTQGWCQVRATAGNTSRGTTT